MLKSRAELVGGSDLISWGYNMGFPFSLPLSPRSVLHNTYAQIFSLCSLAKTLTN